MFTRPRMARGPALALRQQALSALVAIAAIAVMAVPAMAQSSAPPTFGTLEVGPDQAETIRSQALEAGGQDQAAAFGGDCSGMINAAAPDLMVRLTAPVSRLSIFATADADTTLAVRRPNGAFVCDDDTDGVNPAVILLKPAAGDYAVWLGTIAADIAQAQVHLSLTEPDWEAVRGPFEAPPAGADLPDGPARYTAFSMADLPPETPQTVYIVAGGPDPIAAYDAACAGFVEVGMPDVTVAAEAGFGLLSLRARASADTTLAVRLPDGHLLCNDDTYGSDPGLEIVAEQPGTYAVWVGMFDANIADARLEVTRVPPDPARPRDPAPRDTAQDGQAAAPTRFGLALASDLGADPEAARIAQGVIDGLERMLARLDPLGSADLRLTGAAPVIVERDGAMIVVDFPGLELGIGRVRLRLGDPRIEVAPRDGETLAWQAALPPSIEVYRGMRPMGALVWSEEGLSGLTEADTGIALKTDLVLANLAWQPRDPGETLRFEIADLHLHSDLSRTGTGLYDGGGGLELGGIDISDTDGALQIGRLAVQTAVTGSDPGMAEQLGALMEALAAGRPAADALRPFIAAPWGTSDGLIEIADLAFATPAGQGLRLARLHLGSGVDGREDLGSVRLSWSLEGAQADHPDWPEALGTADAALALRISRLPLRQLLGIAANLNPGDDDALGMGWLQALGALIAAGPELEIGTLTLAGGPARLEGQGGLRMVDGMAGEGQMDLVLNGMPELIAMISDGQIGGADAEAILPGLLLVRGLGQPNPQGPEGSLIYRLELRPDNSLTVNGMDLQRMLQ